MSLYLSVIHQLYLNFLILELKAVTEFFAALTLFIAVPPKSSSQGFYF